MGKGLAFFWNAVKRSASGMWRAEGQMLRWAERESRQEPGFVGLIAISPAAHIQTPDTFKAVHHPQPSKVHSV